MICWESVGYVRTLQGIGKGRLGNCTGQGEIWNYELTGEWYLGHANDVVDVLLFMAMYNIRFGGSSII